MSVGAIASSTQGGHDHGRIVQRAREQSKQQGIEQGERKLLRRQLRRRFGLLPPEADERIDRASTRDLESWAENVLDAGTLDEVFDTNH